MIVYIYTYGDELPCARSTIEDSLESALKECGDVTGAGIGEMGCNIDLEIDSSKISAKEALDRILGVLRGYQLPESTEIVVDGVSMHLSYEL